MDLHVQMFIMLVLFRMFYTEVVSTYCDKN